VKRERKSYYKIATTGENNDYDYDSDSAPATPTQQDTMFGVKDAAAVVEEDVD